MYNSVSKQNSWKGESKNEASTEEHYDNRELWCYRSRGVFCGFGDRGRYAVRSREGN